MTIALPFAFRLAGRELRASVRGLRVVLLCLALGVAAIAGVGSLRAGIEAGLAQDGARLLGGDLAVQGGATPLPDTLRGWFAARGAALSDVVTMRSMMVAQGGEGQGGQGPGGVDGARSRLLVELKAVDAGWPLIGSAELSPPGPLAPGAVAAERLVLERLGIAPGAQIRLGGAALRVQALIVQEPDRVANPSIIGPRVLMRMEDLAAANLLQPGAIAEHQMRARLPQGADVAQTIADLRRDFPDTGWRIRDARNAAPNVSQFLERTSLFMTLVGLTSLLVGGIGVANGVRAWLEARAKGIAILRCLGASQLLVFGVCALQVAALAGAGIAVGLMIGALLPALAAAALGDVLPVAPSLGLYARPLTLAASYGALTAAVFALWPLSRAMGISGAALFRDALMPAPSRPRLWLIAATALLGGGLIGLTVLASAERGFAIAFCGAVAMMLLLFRLGAFLLMRGAARVHVRGLPWLRLGLGNLYRPGTATPLMLVSIGLGLSTLSAVTLIQGNVQRQVMEQLPDRAPTFFFIDIQNSQMPQFRAIIAASPGVHDLRDVPNLRARLVSLAGVPVEQVKAAPESAWALRGDRGLTYAGAMPEGTRLVAGSWWPADYRGPPLLSLDVTLAKGWGVKLGDVVRLNILGRDIDLTVASLRDVVWRSMGINFTLMASPGLLERAPHTHIATMRVDPAQQAGLLRAVTEQLPNVSGIWVADILEAVGQILGQLATALAATGSLTLVSGALVLAGAVASGQRRRMGEAVILKSLGASRWQIRGAWLVEFGALGLAAGLLAALVGTGASFAVVHFVMATEWAFLPWHLAAVLAACIALMLVFGSLGTEAALRAKAAPLLRNE